MAQHSAGLYAILARPRIYSRLQRLIARPDSLRTMTADYIKPRPGDRLLDLGCGTADLLAVLPAVDYHGYDLSADCIATARARHGARGTFTQASIDDLPPQPPEHFDIVVALGVLHHLDDAQARRLFAAAAAALKPGGRLVTRDPAFVPGQNRIGRFLIARDRGRNVRTPAQYVALAHSSFPDPRREIRDDLLRVPYTNFVMVATKAAA